MLKFISVRLHVCTAAFLLSSWEIPHQDCSFIFRNAHYSKGTRSLGQTCSVWVFLSNSFAVKMKWCRCALSHRPVCFYPTLCVSGGALLQPDPKCCESLFIKSIPVPWPCSSHANCCLPRPLSLLFSFTCTPTHARTQTCTQTRKAIDIACCESDLA